MKISDLIISPQSLGNKLLLVDVAPYYEYSGNSRTDNVLGYRYTIVLPDRSFDKVAVKIEGNQQIDKPEGYVEVRFTGLELSIYWLNGQPQVGAKATGISVIPEAKH